MNKVDVIINVYGKPYQTLCTLKSLMKHSGQHIDKIYFIEEKQQPYNDNVKGVIKEFDNIVHFIPDDYSFLPRITKDLDLTDPKVRYGFRYQYGIENSDKTFVFITHNDILYTDDIIGTMLTEIDDNVGIGSIGQCWNCPAKNANLCDGERFYDYNPKYYQIIKTCNEFPPARGQQFISMINRMNPMPLPECRLNEFACLINREITNEENIPNNDVPFFGDYSGIDLGQQWFRDMCDKGYTFKNYDINLMSEHLYFAKDAGYQVQLNYEKYMFAESVAKKYWEDNLK